MSVEWRRAMKPAERSWQTLVIVPCGKAKIWATDSNLPKSVPAEMAYVGPLFKLNRRYAETFGDRWIILSAEYGFIWPGTPIQDYDVSFNDRRSNPIDYDELRQQAKRLKLRQFRRIIVLGGRAYCAAASAGIEFTPRQMEFPFVGMPIGWMMKAVKYAVEKEGRE